MIGRNSNIKLASYDYIFSTEETSNAEKLEKVQNIALNELHPFKNHSFKVVDDDFMLKNSRKSQSMVCYTLQLQGQDKKADMN